MKTRPILFENPHEIITLFAGRLQLPKIQLTYDFLKSVIKMNNIEFKFNYGEWTTRVLFDKVQFKIQKN